MLSELAARFVDTFSALNVFRYISVRSFLAALVAISLAFIFGPRLIAKLKEIKFGQSIRSDGPESHKAKSGTPTMGGLLIIGGVIVAVLLCGDLRSALVWLALASFAGFGAIGFIDDWLKIKHADSKGLPAWVKFGAQALVALPIAIILFNQNSLEQGRVYFPFFKNAIFDLGAVWVPVAVIYVVYWSNAVNLADGLDGLATGLVIFALLAFSVLTYITGRQDWATYLNIPYIKTASELTVFNFAMIGACIGFLWFNAHPAEVFMGDVGSLALGGVLGVLSLMVKKEVLLLIIGGVFMMEVLSDVFQVAYFKATKGKRLFRMAPLHHHYELKGWKESKIVTRFWILGGLFALSALSSLKIQ